MKQNEDFHALSKEECLHLFNTSEKGLTQEEAKTRKELFGPNAFLEKKKKSKILTFFLHFHSPLIYVLLFAACATIVLGHILDTIVILLVVIINAVVESIQEGRAERAIEAIKKILTPKTHVIREGKEIEVRSEDLTLGDIVKLSAGDKVPADLRLIQAKNVTIEEASLTGESLPTKKETKENKKETPLAERSSMAFYSTFVASGTLLGVVVRLAGKSEVGKIVEMMTTIETLATPLILKINALAKKITIFILFFAVFILFYGHFLTDLSLHDVLLTALSFTVAASPAGLPAVLTITMAIGVYEMAKRNAIIRKLPAIETIGSISVICSDKTGTITKNKMSLETISKVDGRLSLDEETSKEKKSALAQQIERCCFFAVDAKLVEEKTEVKVLGDAMDGAFLLAAKKMGFDPEGKEQIDHIPFETERGYTATLVKEGEKFTLYVKGSPEALFELSIDCLDDNLNKKKLDRSFFEKETAYFAGKGMRVLGLAKREVPSSSTSIELPLKDLSFLGLACLVDPPREGVLEAIEECKEAGIEVKMITGDHPITAAAIAKQIGLPHSERVVTGKDIDEMSEEELDQTVLEVDIFSRQSPSNKLQIVEAFCRQSLSVAMTGDGINDAPALKKATVGIAMGRHGTEAAKEASEIVLADDSFVSIVHAVEEGRRVFDNIKKVVSWTLPTNAGEALTIVFALLFGFTYPITPLQILWVNMVTAISLGMALAFEKAEPGSMKKPPVSMKTPILTKDLLWHVVFVSCLFLFFVYGAFLFVLEKEQNLNMARTVAVNLLVSLEIFHLLFIRNLYDYTLSLKPLLGTKVVWTTITIVFFAQLFITYNGFLQTVFETDSLPPYLAFLVFFLGLAFFLLLQVEKVFKYTYILPKGSETT